VTFDFPPNNQNSTPSTIQLLHVEVLARRRIPPALRRRYPRLARSGG
jgi:hypothetical protein